MNELFSISIKDILRFYAGLLVCFFSLCSCRVIPMPIYNLKFALWSAFAFELGSVCLRVVQPATSFPSYAPKPRLAPFSQRAHPPSFIG